MKGKNILIVAGAAVAAYLLLRQFGGGTPTPQYWATAQGNTGYPREAMTGGGVWV